MDVAVDAVAVGPVALHGDEGKALLRDQSPADPRSPVVVLGRPVRGFAQEHKTCVADPVEQRVQIVGPAERSGELTDLVAESRGSRGLPP